MSDSTEKFKATIYFLDDTAPIIQHFTERRRTRIWIGPPLGDEYDEPSTLAHDFASKSMKDGAKIYLQDGQTLYIPPYRIRHIIVEGETVYKNS